MDAFNPLESLVAAGLSLRTDGEQLIVTPASALTDALRNLIRQNKPRLIADVRNAEALSRDLIASINRCCDVRGDDDANRAALISESAQVELRLLADLREHFDQETVRLNARMT